MLAIRTIRREWKAILGGAFVISGLAFTIYEFYHAWAYGTVRSVPLVPSLYRFYCNLIANSGCSGRAIPQGWISFSTYPGWFAVSLTGSIVATIVLSALAALVFRDWRTVQRNLNSRDSRPPLDNSIHESIDR